ncbi:MAG: hypothetical protein E7590_04475 [Ruminococcaceae bacterium]|nr:hypothetical protein [Oscillospiraceae bacterium]
MFFCRFSPAARWQKRPNPDGVGGCADRAKIPCPKEKKDTKNGGLFLCNIFADFGFTFVGIRGILIIGTPQDIV